MIPGIWDSGAQEGQVCIRSDSPFDVPLDTGAVIGELCAAAVQTRVCNACGRYDTDAWVVGKDTKRCLSCNTPTPAGPSRCRQCGAPPELCSTLTYAGCIDCRPEKHLAGQVRRGPAAGMLAKAALAFAALCAVVPEGSLSGAAQPVSPGNFKVDVNLHPVFHIVEEPGMMAHMADCEVPTEVYYDALKKDFRPSRTSQTSISTIRHPLAIR